MRRRGPVVVAVVFGAVAMIAMLFLVLPKMSAVDKSRAALATQQSKEQTLQLRLSQLQQAKKDAPQVLQQLADLKIKIPPTEDAPGLIRLVADTADAASMNVSTLTPGAATVDGSGKFAIIPVSINVQGTFFSLEDFLFKLETLPRAMKVTSMGISAGADPFELNVSLSVEIYTTDVGIGSVG